MKALCLPWDHSSEVLECHSVQNSGEWPPDSHLKRRNAKAALDGNATKDVTTNGLEIATSALVLLLHNMYHSLYWKKIEESGTGWFCECKPKIMATGRMVKIRTFAIKDGSVEKGVEEYKKYIPPVSQSIIADLQRLNIKPDSRHGSFTRSTIANRGKWFMKASNVSMLA